MELKIGDFKSKDLSAVYRVQTALQPGINDSFCAVIFLIRPQHFYSVKIDVKIYCKHFHFPVRSTTCGPPTLIFSEGKNLLR